MTSKYNARRDAANNKERYLAMIQKRDSNRKQPLYPPPAQEAQEADDYLMPVSSLKRPETTDKKTTKDEKPPIRINIDDENPYQSLILPKFNVEGEEGYVKLKHSASVSILDGTPPPPLPPKPEPVSTLELDISQLECNLPPSEHTYGNRLQTL